MKFLLLTLNKPNKNGRVYSTEVINECINSIKNELSTMKILVLNNETDASEGHINNPVGYIKELEIKNDVLYADVIFTDVDEDILVLLKNKLLSIRTHGTGVLTNENDTSIVTDYKLKCVFITDFPA